MKKTTKASKSTAPVRKPKAGAVPAEQTAHDLRNAVLIISLLINIFVLGLWIAVFFYSKYDTALTNFLFGR